MYMGKMWIFVHSNIRILHVKIRRSAFYPRPHYVDIGTLQAVFFTLKVCKC